MRQMTIEEQRKLLAEIAHGLWGAGMMLADAVCYGSIASVDKHKSEEGAFDRMIKAIPKDIRDAYNAEIRKAEADKLRAKAARVERGEEA